MKMWTEVSETHQLATEDRHLKDTIVALRDERERCSNTVVIGLKRSRYSKKP